MGKRTLSVLAACILALCLAACGGTKNPSDEELIDTTISSFMNSFKSPTEERLSPYIGSTDTSTFDAYGIDVYEFLGHLFKRLDYSIDSVEVEGDTARATLSVTNVDISAIMDEASATFEENILTYTDGIDMASDTATQDLMAKLFDLIYELIDTTDDFATSQVAITLTKSDGVWRIDDSSAQALVSAMYGGMEL